MCKGEQKAWGVAARIAEEQGATCGSLVAKALGVFLMAVGLACVLAGTIFGLMALAALMGVL